MAEKSNIPTEEQLYRWSLGWREFDSKDDWTTEERILRNAARCIHDVLSGGSLIWPTLSQSHLLAITTAYEQGYGKGMQGTPCSNPYSENGSQANAWKIGYDEGYKFRIDHDVW